MKWHEEVLDANGKRAAARLASVIRNEFYLAGGTALTLRFGHRVSLDLDLFSRTNPLLEPQRRSLLESIGAAGNVEVIENKDGTCHLRLERTSVSLFHYPYTLLGRTQIWKGLQLASVEDIAAMKVSAIIGRGSRKDFVDLYVICNTLGLERILDSADCKFSPDIIIQAARALVYFNDAEKESMPRLFRPISWIKIKAFFESEVPKAVQRRIEKR